MNIITIEYHRALLTGLLDEREARRVKHAHRYAGEPLPKRVDSATVTQTVTKTTKAVRSTKSTATAAGMVQSMLAKGLSAEQMLTLLKALQAKAGVTK